VKSIRQQLTGLLILSLGLLCIAVGLTGRQAIRNIILQEFDYSLITKAHDLSTLTEWEHNEYSFEFVEKRMPEFERVNNPEYYQISLETGDLIGRSRSLGAGQLSLPAGTLSEKPELYHLILPGGVPGRAAAITVMPQWGEKYPEPQQHHRKPVTIIIARDTLHLNELFRKIDLGFIAGLLGLFLVVILSVTWIVRRGLRPLNTLAQQVVAIDSENLNTRLPLTSVPDELIRIVEQLNHLLARIESAFQRERHLTAGMAHELYTPIAELRSITEVALKWPDDQESTAGVISSARDIALQMQHMVDVLLSLSRYESGVQRVDFRPVDLNDLLNELRQSIEPSAQNKQLQVRYELSPIPLIIADRIMLQTVLSNLLNNAVEYTPSQGEVSCSLTSTACGWELRLTNTNPALVPEDLPHLFEPLWRKDASRTGSAHCGLGLALSNRCCALLGFQLEASLPQQNLFRMTLTIPAQKIIASPVEF